VVVGHVGQSLLVDPLRGHRQGGVHPDRVCVALTTSGHCHQAGLLVGPGDRQQLVGEHGAVVRQCRAEPVADLGVDSGGQVDAPRLGRGVPTDGLQEGRRPAVGEQLVELRDGSDDQGVHRCPAGGGPFPEPGQAGVEVVGETGDTGQPVLAGGLVDELGPGCQ